MNKWLSVSVWSTGHSFGRRQKWNINVLSFSSVLAHQQPNAKKLRRSAQKAEQLAAKGVLPRRQKLLLRRKAAAAASKATERIPANNHPERPFYDLWGEQSE